MFPKITYATYPDPSTEEFTYGTGVNDANMVIQKKDRDNNLTRYFYDQAGRKIVEVTGIAGTGSRNPEHQVYQGWTYLDGADKVAAHRSNAKYLDPANSSQWTGGNLETFEYDYRGRMVSRTSYSSQSKSLTSRTIYQNNLVAATVDPYGRATWYVYDLNARPIRVGREAVPGSLGSTATTAGASRNLSPNVAYTLEDTVYNAEGETLARIDARGVVSSFVYDNQGRLVKDIRADRVLNGGSYVVVPEASQTLYTYDRQGNRTSVTHPRSFTRQPDGSFTAGTNCYVLN